MTIRRLLLAVALPVLAASTAHGQTTFFASGGDVTFNPTGFSDGVVFQVFLDALGSHTTVLSDNGTQYSMPGLGQVANTSIGALGILHLGPFAAGTPLIFTYAVNGRSYNSVAFYRQTLTGWNVQFSDLNGVNLHDDIISLSLTGLGAATGLQCPGATEISSCSTLTQVTSTPEPGTIALFATGLAGLIPVVRRRRRATGQPSL